MDKNRVLIVDDDPIARDVLTQIFTQTGTYVAETVSDGIEGLQRVSTIDYDMVFTDLTMPGIGGMVFLREAARLKPGLPVVVITGHSTTENVINAMREGAKDFITKPFNVAAITSIADQIIGERKLLRSIGESHNSASYIGRLNAELFKRLQEVSILQTLSTELDALYNNKDIYEKIVEMASRLLPAREISFGIIENDIFKIRSAIGVRARNIPVPGTLFERVLKTGYHTQAAYGEADPHTGDPLTRSFCSIPFTIRNEVFALLNLANKGDGDGFTEDEIALALTFAKKAAQRIENNALYDVFYSNLINTLKSLVFSIEARDSYTRQHSERVTTYAARTAEAMRLGPEDVDALRCGGYIHDIGKIGVRDTVLLKPGRLSPEETVEINLHPVIGGNIIQPLRFFPKEREIILYHHEQFDGSGYPGGLAGDRIPLTARILAVADAFDAMTTTRPYREARTQAFAVSELLRCSNTQFDGEVVRAFLRTLNEHPISM
jgi:putative nucleotidyltransferase with HDIG domain